MHQVQIRLVLLGCCCAEADGIAEVVGRQAGHDGVEIDDAESFSGFLVKQDVVQLCVIVCDAERKESFFLLFYKYAAVVLSCKDEIDLRTAGRRFRANLKAPKRFTVLWKSGMVSFSLDAG